MRKIVAVVGYGPGRCRACQKVFYYAWFPDQSVSCTYCGIPAVERIPAYEPTPDDMVCIFREIDRLRDLI